MSTINQLLNNSRINKKKKSKTLILNKNPQKKGFCLKFFIITPKKPNSGQRKVVRLRLTNKKEVTVYVPGNNMFVAPYSDVLIRGGNTPDLPGIKYKVILGKLSMMYCHTRKNRKSKYGIKKSYKNVT
uniref:Ribosomal protein 12 n=1 Tax=Babesia duncani TaxID=323732 RepID=A0A385GNJ4_9APIC|nr:ribosomal protein 12 [Babesia duncani]